MDKAELSGVCSRLLGSGPGNRRDEDIRVVALALQRFLLHEGRRKSFDKKVYMKDYMRRYREEERRRANKRRRVKAKG